MKIWRKAIFGVLYVFAVIVFIVFTLGPIAWSFILSITPQAEIGSNTTRILPENPTFGNYIKLVSAGSQEGSLFLKGMKNSLVAACLALLLGMPIAILAAYPMSRIPFKGSVLIRNVLLFTMAIPVFATVIPLYKLFINLNLMDSYIGLVLVYITSFLPMAVWLLIGYFSTIPKELEEAAYVDGCSRFGTMVKVILPVCYPIVFAASLIMFLNTWNQFQIPLILAPGSSTKPIAVVISEFVTKSTMDIGLMNAGGILALIPPAVIAIIFRRFLVSGIVGGAVKG